MFTPERMHQINVLVFESEVENVARAIVKLGVLHLVRLEEDEPWVDTLKDYDTSSVQGKISNLRDRIVNIMNILNIRKLPLKEVDEGDFGLTRADFDRMDEEISSIESALEELLARKRELTSKIDRLRSVLSEIVPLARAGIESLKGPYSFIEVRYGEVTEENYGFLVDELAPMAAVALRLSQESGMVRVLVIGLKKDRLKLKRILREAAFKDVEVSEEVGEQSGVASGELEKKIESLKDEISEIDREINRISRERAGEVLDCHRALQVAHLLMKVKQYLKKTSKTYVFSGWVPARKRKLVESEILKAARGRAIIEVVSPEEIIGVKQGKVKVPVLLRHPGFFRPFEMLVSSYGLPDYTFVDPTIFVAVSFLVMFGIMFGDIGHGVVLALIGWYIGYRYKRASESVKLVGRLYLYCGISSAVFGVLFGSIFGIEDAIPHLWIKPMSNVLYFFKVAVYFGIVMISLGIIFNILNAVRARNLRAGLFDHAGLVSAIIYWGGIGIVSRFLSNRPIPVKLIVYSIIIPVIILFLKEPIMALFTRRRPHFSEGVGTYIMEGVIEVMEVVTGYLANTVSFIRVAAFSLAHVGLFIAVFSLADMVKGSSGGAIYSSLVLILGNMLIIALEGLVVTIQAIRLEYYEFFGKFFSGGGVAYKPIGLGEVSRNE